MKQKRGARYLITALLLGLCAGGFLLLKQKLRAAHPAGAPPVTQREQSVLDLRPALIAKLQSAVQQGSDSLYQLRLDSLHTDLATGAILLTGVHLSPDSAVIRRLIQAKNLPDDVFDIRFARLRISGISLADLLHRRDVSIHTLTCDEPVIILHHQPQPYNAAKRSAAQHQTMAARLKNAFDRLSIDSILLLHATLIDHSGQDVRSFKDVSVALRDMLIDSAAERDTTRFLFAKQALLHAGDILLPAGDSHYDLSIGSLDIDAAARRATVRNLGLRPHSAKDAFLRTQKTQGEVYDIAVPLMTLSGLDWWAAAHGDALLARDAAATGASIYVYLDKRMPESGSIKRDNFPQQMLVNLSAAVSLGHVQLKDAALTYEEYTASSDRRSSISFNALNISADGLTNLPKEIAARPVARLTGACRFMNTTQMDGRFSFELPKARRGAFSAEIGMGSMDYTTVNLFAESMGLVRFTSGRLSEAHAQIAGNNDNVHGTLAAVYNDLHIAPLKTKERADGRFKKRSVLELLANGLLVKNNNPAGNAPLRTPDFSLDRTTEGNFFNFTWLGLKKGLLKAIGVPAKLGM